MKKYSALLCLIAAGTTGWSFPSADEIRSWPELGSKTLVYGNGFEAPSPEIKLGPGFRYAPGEGNNGNTALRVDRSEAIKKMQSTFLHLPGDRIRPGFRYTVVIGVKGKNVRHDTRPVPPSSFRFMETLYFNPKGGDYLYKQTVVPFAVPPTEEGFKEFTYSFPGVKDHEPHLRLALWVDFHGTIWFDDLRVYQEGVTANAFLLEPQCAAFFAESGAFRLRTHFPDEYKNIVILATLEKAGKIIREQVIPVDAGRYAAGDFGKALPEGDATLRIILADAQNRQRLKTVELPAQVRKEAKPPRGAVRFDRHGRMLIDGKPTLPLGIFYGSMPFQREENYKLLADSPFNFITDYSALSMALPQDTEKLTAIRKGMDDLHRAGLKVVFNLTPFYVSHSNYVKRGWAGETGTLNMTRKLAEAIKEHPALLGWYLTDELSEEQLPLPVAMRNLLNKVDPYHPTFTLTNLPSALPNYAVSGDVLMLDPYPLGPRKRGKEVEREISTFMKQARLPGVPVWAVPQAFNWGTSKFLNRSRAEFDTFIEPSEEDMRSMALLCAIDGATGFSFYTFPFPWDTPNQKRYAELGLDGYREKMWSKIKGMARSVKSLEPYLLSLEPAPAAEVKNAGKATVRARAWRAGDGRHCLVVVGGGGAPADAVVTLPEAPNLKSQYGRTVNLGGGKYRFTSPDLGSDILFE